MVKYEKKTFSIDEAEEQAKPLQKIVRLIAQEYDNEIAKAFTLHITKLLKDNGIVPIMTERPTDYNTITDANTYKMAVKFGISFDELDTSEHDAKVREEAIEEFAEKLSNWIIDEALDVKINGILANVLTAEGVTDMIFDLADRLKEQKDGQKDED